MMNIYNSDFRSLRGNLARDLLMSNVIHVGEFQGQNVSMSDAHATHEITDVIVRVHVPQTIERLQIAIDPDLPWAEEHFFERVSGQPLNPPPSHITWPHARRNNGEFITAGTFGHTYPERFWPKFAATMGHHGEDAWIRSGIRFRYGDLDDVVDTLIANTETRQAYLPVWFPEDTGGSHRVNDRVPCSLGYHFMVRRDVMTCRYFIRSCDFIRHFTNDVYMAARLLQWVCDKLTRYRTDVTPGELIMYVSSLHSFVGDTNRVRGMMNE